MWSFPLLVAACSVFMRGQACSAGCVSVLCISDSSCLFEFRAFPPAGGFNFGMSHFILGVGTVSLWHCVCVVGRLMRVCAAVDG